MNLRNNLGLKLVALFLAFAAWVYVHSQVDIQRAVVVPLDLSGLPEHYIEVSDAVPDVTVHLRGPETFLGGLPAERVRVRPDLAGQALKVGTNRVPLDITLVRAPAGITVERISPGFVEIELDERITKEVAVLPAIQGQPAPGYEIVESRSIPPRLTVKGPRQALAELDAISTQTVAIEGIRETVRQPARPLVVGANPALVTLQNRQDVEVLIRVEPLSAEKTLAGVAVRAAGLAGPPAPALAPTTATVRARGPREKIRTLQGGDLVVEVRLQGAAGEALEIPAAELQVVAAPGSAADLAGLDLEVTAPAVLRVTWPALQPAGD